jgi:flagellar assembly protein FliH
MSTPTINNYTFQQLERSDCTDRTPADVMARALADAQELRAQALTEGHAAGYAAGVEQARSEAGPLLASLADATRSVTDTREELAETLTAQAGELALLTAEHIVAGAIAAEPRRITDVVRGALRRLSDRHRVTVLVNPEDLELLSASVKALQAELGGIENLDIQADRRIARGGAIAQTVYGEIDVTIGAQLQTAREIVAAALAGDSDAEQPSEAGSEAAIPDDV